MIINKSLDISKFAKKENSLKNTAPMDLYQRIQDLKKEKKKRDSEMAHALDMEQSNYVRVEKKGARLTYEQIEKIAAGLGVSTKELLFEDSEVAQTINTKENEELRKEIDELRRNIEVLTLKNDSFRGVAEYYSSFVESAREIGLEQTEEKFGNALGDYFSEIFSKMKASPPKKVNKDDPFYDFDTITKKPTKI